MNGLFQIGNVGYLKVDCVCGRRNCNLISTFNWDVTADGRTAMTEFECVSCKKVYNITCKPIFMAPVQAESDDGV